MGLARQDPQARDHDAVRLAVRSNPHKENSDNDDQNFPDSRKEKQGRAAAGTIDISVEAKPASKALAAELACDEEPRNHCDQRGSRHCKSLRGPPGLSHGCRGPEQNFTSCYGVTFARQSLNSKRPAHAPISAVNRSKEQKDGYDVRFWDTRMPDAETIEEERITWYAHVHALPTKEPGAPEPRVLRQALFAWAFNSPPAISTSPRSPPPSTGPNGPRCPSPSWRTPTPCGSRWPPAPATSPASRPPAGRSTGRACPRR